jgi:hypothetical protein
MAATPSRKNCDGLLGVISPAQTALFEKINPFPKIFLPAHPPKEPRTGFDRAVKISR